MAKIRIQEAENSPEPSEDGYVVLVKKLVYGTTDAMGEDTYEDFWDAEPDERVEILKDAATIKAADGTVLKKFWVTHLVKEKDQNGQIVEVPREIHEDDCRIIVTKDKIKRRRVKKSKLTVALPEGLTSKNNSDYLAPYAQIIYDLYRRAKNKEDAGDLAGAARLRSRAHTFMFGMMLFTRCR
jgi:hypothetical protein